MKYCNSSILIICLLFSLQSCNYFRTLGSDIEEDIVLQIGEYKLTEDQIPDFGQLSESESKRLRDDYIQRWKKETVLAYYADQELSGDPLIERQLKEIRGQYLSSEYLDLYLQANAISNIPEDKIQMEFDSNLSAYTPVPVLFKLRYIVTDPKVPENKEILQLFTSEESDDYYALELFSIKNSFASDIVGETWKTELELAEVLPKSFFERTKMPIGRPFLLEEDDFHAYIIVDDISESMNQPPYDYMRDLIKERLIQQENQAILTEFYTSLMKKANSEGILLEQ